MAEAKAYGYVRVSTEEQAREGVSLAQQRARIAAWSEATGTELVAVFEDAGISGKRADNRPALQDALRAACRERCALVVCKMDRLSRSTRDHLAIAARLEKAGADLVSLGERIDTQSAVGRMFFTICAAFAQYERDLISERTAAAFAHKRSNGEKTGGAVPFGYDLADDGIHLVPNDQEQGTICLARRLRRNGRSLREIGRELDRRGVTTKQGRQWSAVQVSRACTVGDTAAAV